MINYTWSRTTDAGDLALLLDGLTTGTTVEGIARGFNLYLSGSPTLKGATLSEALQRVQLHHGRVPNPHPGIMSRPMGPFDRVYFDSQFDRCAGGTMYLNWATADVGSFRRSFARVTPTAFRLFLRHLEEVYKPDMAPVFAVDHCYLGI